MRRLLDALLLAGLGYVLLHAHAGAAPGESSLSSAADQSYEHVATPRSVTSRIAPSNDAVKIETGGQVAWIQVEHSAD